MVAANAQKRSVSQLCGSAPELEDDEVEQPLALQDPPPDQPDDDRRQQHRKEEDGAPEAAGDDLAIEDQRRDHRHDGHQRHLQDDEERRVVDRVPEQVLAAGQRIEIVPAIEQALILRGPDVGPVGEEEGRSRCRRVEEIDDQRHQDEDAEDGHVRRQEERGHAAGARRALPCLERRVDDRGKPDDRRRKRGAGPVLADRSGRHFAWATLSAMSWSILGQASSSVSSPAMTWLTRVTSAP